MNINFVIPDELHAWAKDHSQLRGLSLTAYLRGLIVKDRAQISIATPPRQDISPLDVIRPTTPPVPHRVPKPIDEPSYEDQSVQVETV